MKSRFKFKKRKIDDVSENWEKCLRKFHEIRHSNNESVANFLYFEIRAN
jgi:hypothetical protein